MKDKKRILLVGILVMIVIAVITIVLVIPKNTSEKPSGKPEENNKIEPALKDYGTKDFSIKEYKEMSENSTLYEDQYLLSDEAWQLNIVKDKKYEPVQNYLSDKLADELSSNDTMKFESETKHSNGEIHTTYKYKGYNLFMFQFDLNNLSVLIQHEVAQTVDMDRLTKEEMNDYLGRSHMKATDILLHYADEYKETEERSITVIKKNGKIINSETVYNEMMGINSPNIPLAEGEYVYGQTFITQREIRVKQIFEEAKKKGYYDPKNPLDIKIEK